MNKLVRKNKKGFTLTEMIVVIAIIGILAAVMIPSVVVYVRKARQNAAYQEAVAVLDVYEAYQTELAAGLVFECEIHGKAEGTCGTCGKDQNATNVFNNFAEYYESITKKEINQNPTITASTFTYKASNDITVSITLSDMSASYN